MQVIKGYYFKHKETGEIVRLDKTTCPSTHDAECSLSNDENDPPYRMKTYEDAIRILYKPHNNWYQSYEDQPMHDLTAEEYDIVQGEETLVINKTEKHSLTIAKDLYNDIINWMYGEGCIYENTELLEKKLKDNKGVIDRFDLKEYLDYKEK